MYRVFTAYLHTYQTRFSMGKKSHRKCGSVWSAFKNPFQVWKIISKLDYMVGFIEGERCIL